MAPRTFNNLPDWLFGSPARWLVIERLFREPEREWTKSQLARAVELQRASVREPVEGLDAIGALRRNGRRFGADPGSAAGQALALLTSALRPLQTTPPP